MKRLPQLFEESPKNMRFPFQSRPKPLSTGVKGQNTPGTDRTLLGLQDMVGLLQEPHITLNRSQSSAQCWINGTLTQSQWTMSL